MLNSEDLNFGLLRGRNVLQIKEQSHSFYFLACSAVYLENKCIFHICLTVISSSIHLFLLKTYLLYFFYRKVFIVFIIHFHFSSLRPFPPFYVVLLQTRKTQDEYNLIFYDEDVFSKLFRMVFSAHVCTCFAIWNSEFI